MRAVLIESEGATPRLLEDADESLLSGDVELDVLVSSFNYKDGMAIAGKGIARSHPLIPGIDLVGRVTDSAGPTGSADERFSAGDLVILTGDGIGETRHGGFATRARVRPDALVRLPADLSPERAAAIGTAGFTAMLAVLSLEDAGLTPDAGDVLVTGASGGAGSVAVALLAGRGFRVLASTGRSAENGEYLRELGAAEVIGPSGTLRGAGTAPAVPALRWRDRRGGQHDACQRPRPNLVGRHGRRLRSRPGPGPPDDRAAVHPARGDPRRYQLGGVPTAAA